MGYLLKMLTDMLQNPQPLSDIHICPKPKVKLGPTKTIYLAPPSSDVIATASNPSLSVSPSSQCKLSVSLSKHFGTIKMSEPVPPSLPDQLCG